MELAFLKFSNQFAKFFHYLDLLLISLILKFFHIHFIETIMNDGLDSKSIEEYFWFNNMEGNTKEIIDKSVLSGSTIFSKKSQK